ncbi:MAG TPA: SPOR domain-containing protein [Novosphingobium sp.]|nr:SPOR domain-containing protein [Novosphingobium sp.]
MQRLNNLTRTAGLALCSAAAVALVSGCAGPTALAGSGNAQAARSLSDADGDAGVARAEQRVARSPDSASARAELAQAYLAAGRFGSAATTFEDVAALGGDNARIGLGMALAYAGLGRDDEAFAVLGRWRGQLPASDFGLAVALAGQPAMGIAVLTDAVRGGDDNAKTRQNLAYAYALAGQWTQARLIASQDVPADQLDARLAEWAAKARPEASRERVAGLIGAPMRGDPGQPAALALGGRDDGVRLAAAETVAPARELPPVMFGQSTDNGFEPAAQALAPEPAAGEALAVVAEEPAPRASAKFVATPVIQQAVRNESTFQASFDRMATTRSAQSAKPRPAAQTHLVQLGSFTTREGAQRAWAIFVKRDPALKSHVMRISEADVNGRRYYRVSAEGFNRTSALSMCAAVKRRGEGCLAYSEQHPLLGRARGQGAVGATLRAR